MAAAPSSVAPESSITRQSSEANRMSLSQALQVLRGPLCRLLKLITTLLLLLLPPPPPLLLLIAISTTTLITFVVGAVRHAAHLSAAEHVTQPLVRAARCKMYAQRV